LTTTVFLQADAPNSFSSPKSWTSKYCREGTIMDQLCDQDPEIYNIVEAEKERIENTLDLIAAENHATPPILEALGSAFNMKAAEGYPGRRFHAGCGRADDLETLAIQRGKKLFGAEHINVQPHSGTSANFAVYFSVLKPGDRILAMKLSHGDTASITALILIRNNSIMRQSQSRLLRSNPK
jgi:glycine/serine hydroxymethyltransferase